MGVKSALSMYVKSYRLRRAGAVIGEGLRLNGRPRIMLVVGSKLTIGRSVVLNSKWAANALGMQAPTTIITTNDGAEILIGDCSGVSGSVLSAAASIRIGSRVLIGDGCLITDNDHHPVDIGQVSLRRSTPLDPIFARPVVIEDDVFLGARSTVLKGVTIGAGTVVGAGSVVSASLPAGVIAAGNPCRVIRDLRSSSSSSTSGAATL